MTDKTKETEEEYNKRVLQKVKEDAHKAKAAAQVEYEKRQYEKRVSEEIKEELNKAKEANEKRLSEAKKRILITDEIANCFSAGISDFSNLGNSPCPHPKGTPTLIIGDIHSNFVNDKARIEKAIEEKKPSKIVFLGDYVDTRDQSPFDPEDAEFLMKDLELFVNWKKKLDIDCVCLCGNHDWGYLSNGEFPTGQTIKEEGEIPEGFLDEVSNLLLELKLQLCEIVFNSSSLFVCSHAGFCGKWLEINNFFNEETRNKKFAVNDPLYAEDIVKTVNDMFEYLLTVRKIAHPNVIEYCGRLRGGWDSCSGPLWCDRQELLNDFPNCFNQIIGHTKSMGNYNVFLQNYNKRELWSIDTSSSKKQCGILSTDEM